MIRFVLLFLAWSLLPTPVLAAPAPIDGIIAIVEDDIITRRELNDRLEIIRTDFEQNNQRLPEKDTLNRQLLELMINESILSQEAKRRGIRISDSQLNQAMQNIAKNNQKSLSSFRDQLISQGFNYKKYRETIRQEIALTTLRRQYTNRTANISESELDEFIKRTGNQLESKEYNISHILLALPDAASPEKVSGALDSANKIIARLEQGDAFEQLANEFSSGSTALQGGSLGWRKSTEVPNLFLDAVLNMQVGDYIGPLRSPSGFHIVKLNDVRVVDQILIPQTRSRHILISANEVISEEAAKNRLVELRQRILEGEDFGALAQLYSVDYASGAEKGDIGWMAPGETVSEYESVADALADGEISEPFKSPFGWHIVEVTGRRTRDETITTKRNEIYQQLLQQKQIEIFEVWQQRLRDEAYVIILDA